MTSSMNIIGDDLLDENVDDLLGNIEQFGLNSVGIVGGGNDHINISSVVSGGALADHAINEKILNIINFNKDYHINNNVNKQDIIHVNNIIKNNISSRFEVVKMFGIGIHGKLYLLHDKETGRKFICKKISKKTITPEIKNQLEFELDILSYLSSNKSVRKYVNPCLKYHVDKSDIFTIFPMLDAIPLSKLKTHLVELNKKNRIEVIKKLIKNILIAVANIHKLNVAHQNINSSNILISINKAEDDINVKLTEFGLGCGNYKIPIDDQYNIKNTNYKVQKCRSTPMITRTNLNELRNSKFLESARLQDNWNMGLIFLDLIVNDREDPEIDINLDRYLEYDDQFEEEVLSKLLILLENGSINNEYSVYLREILNGLCGELENRTNAMHVLDNLIFYEKYEEDD